MRLFSRKFLGSILLTIGILLRINFDVKDLNSNDPMMTIHISDHESVSADVSFQGVPIAGNATFRPYIMVIAIPFKVAPNTFQPEDGLRISTLTQGEDFTLFSAMIAQDQNEYKIHFINLGEMADANGNRAKLQFDPTYSNLDIVEHQLITTTYSVAFWNYLVKFPIEYDQTDVTIFPPTLITWEDPKTLYMPATSSQLPVAERTSVVIPSSKQNNAIIGEIIIGFLLGILTFSLENYQFRRKIGWLLSTLAVSGLIISISLHYGFMGGINFPFIAVAAFGAPLALGSLYSCVYSLLALKFEAMVNINIFLDNVAFDLVEVAIEVDRGYWRHLKRKVTKLADGKHTFYIWLWKPTAKYRIIPGTSTEFSTTYQGNWKNLEQGKTKVETIHLLTLPNHPQPSL